MITKKSKIILDTVDKNKLSTKDKKIILDKMLIDIFKSKNSSKYLKNLKENLEDMINNY